MKITKISIKLDSPDAGRRIATAEIEIDGILTVRGFGVFPDGAGWGLKVYPPSGRGDKGERIPLFDTTDKTMGSETNTKILELVEAELKKREIERCKPKQ